MKTKIKAAIILLSLMCAMQTVRPVSLPILLQTNQSVTVNAPDPALTFQQVGSIINILNAIVTHDTAAVTVTQVLQQGHVPLDITLGNSQEPLISWSTQFDPDSEIIPKLIEYGFDVTATNTAGATALHNAISSTAVAQTLIENGADVNAQANSGTTPLLRAARAAEPEMVQLLLDNSANPAIQNNAGVTPLSAAEAMLEINQDLCDETQDAEDQAPYQQEIQKLQNIIEILQQAN